MFLEKSIGTGSRVSSIDTDGTIVQAISRAGLFPQLNVLIVTPAPALRKDRIDLRYRQSFDRVVLVDVDGERIDGDRKRGGFKSEFSLEGINLGIFHCAGHRPKLRRAFDQGRRSGTRSLAFDLDFDVGILFAKSFSPQRHEIVERIRADTVDIAGHPADFDVGFQGWVELDRVIGKCRWDTGNKSPQEGEAPETGLDS